MDTIDQILMFINIYMNDCVKEGLHPIIRELVITMLHNEICNTWLGIIKQHHCTIQESEDLLKMFINDMIEKTQTLGIEKIEMMNKVLKDKLGK